MSLGTMAAGRQAEEVMHKNHSFDELFSAYHPTTHSHPATPPNTTQRHSIVSWSSPAQLLLLLLQLNSCHTLFWAFVLSVTTQRHFKGHNKRARLMAQLQHISPIVLLVKFINRWQVASCFIQCYDDQPGQ